MVVTHRKKSIETFAQDVPISSLPLGGTRECPSWLPVDAALGSPGEIGPDLSAESLRDPSTLSFLFMLPLESQVLSE